MSIQVAQTPSATVVIDDDAALRIAHRIAAMEADAMEAVAPQGLGPLWPEDPDWTALSVALRTTFARNDHAVLKGLPSLDGGRALMAVMSLLGRRFRTYRNDRVVKLFAMTPWSRDLAHTAADGYFHTDLNASPEPPALTGIQCIVPDPGAPDYGVNRVIRVTDLLHALRDQGDEEAVRFLCDTEVALANDRSPTIWRGRIIGPDRTRFHPQTIRMGCARLGVPTPDAILDRIQDAALAASQPLSLDAGDMLLLSNARTLHYRGECSVSFQRFPTEFTARRVYVLHLSDEHTEA